MELNEAIKIMFDAQAKLRTSQGINLPAYISQEMQRLAQATGAVEEKLAEYEQEYEMTQSTLLKRFMLDEKMNATGAEKNIKIELGELKGKIVYLGRLVGSAWKQVGVCQSRINHLTSEWNQGAKIT